MKRIVVAIALAVAVGLGLLGLGSHSTAAAPPTTRPAEALCEAHGETFIDLGGLAYVCLAGTGESFGAGQVRAASQVCEAVYQGQFFVATENTIYTCVRPPPDPPA